MPDDSPLDEATALSWLQNGDMDKRVRASEFLRNIMRQEIKNEPESENARRVRLEAEAVLKQREPRQGYV